MCVVLGMYPRKCWKITLKIKDKKGIYSYIIGKESDPELINYIEKLLEERKKELRIKSK